MSPHWRGSPATIEAAPGVEKSQDEIAKAYDSPPWWYDLRGFLILTFAYNSTLERQLRLFGNNFGKQHLEVACGTGTLLDLALRWRRKTRRPPTHVTGFDYADSMLAGAKRRFAGRPDVALCHADAAVLPYADASFDTANIANSAHCFPNLDKVLAEVFRVLRPGGTLAVNVLLYPRTTWPLRAIAQRINAWGIRKGILFTPYHADDVTRRLERVSFEVLHKQVAGNCVEVVARRPATRRQ